MESSLGSHQPKQPQTHSATQHLPQPSPLSTGIQIRSRITVVCAECKRLKLKCDRRSPCGSCTKRETVARCVYSPAAAERIDLHSLNNRLIVVESALANFSSGNASGPSSLSLKNHPSSGGASLSSFPASTVGVDPNTSSILISWRDISSIFVEETLGRVDAVGAEKSEFTEGPHVKVEPTSILLPLLPSSSFTPLIPFESSPPSRDGTSPHAYTLPPLSAYYPPFSRTRGNETPQPMVTQSLLSLVPSPSIITYSRLLKIAAKRAGGSNGILSHYWRTQARSLFSKGIHAMGPKSIADEKKDKAASKSRSDTAKAIFFGSGPTASNVRSLRRSESPQPLGISSACAGSRTFSDRDDNPREKVREWSRGVETETAGREASRDVTLFAAVCAALALGKDVIASSSNSPHAVDSGDTEKSPGFYRALATQALSVVDLTVAGGSGGSGVGVDLEYVRTCLLLVMGGMARGKMEGIFALLGKAVNAARLVGLSSDPEELPGRYSATEVEDRRRIWWELVCTDVFVSDYLGQAPLIADCSYLTRPPDGGGSRETVPSAFEPSFQIASSLDWGVRCRLALVVKSVKRRIRESVHAQGVYTIELASQLEDEVQRFLKELPQEWALDMSTVEQNLSATASRNDGAPPPSITNRCEVTVTAHRLILKLYLPFLRPRPGGNVLHQASHGIVNAAHAIIHASTVLQHYSCLSKDRVSERLTHPISLFELYPAGRAVLDAAVICARAVVSNPSTMWAGVALEDVGRALEFLKALSVDSPSPLPNSPTSPLSYQPLSTGLREGLGGVDAVAVVKEMLNRAQDARSGKLAPNVGSLTTKGMLKRKYVEIEARGGSGKRPAPNVEASVSAIAPSFSPSALTVPSSVVAGESASQSPAQFSNDSVAPGGDDYGTEPDLPPAEDLFPSSARSRIVKTSASLPPPSANSAKSTSRLSVADQMAEKDKLAKKSKRSVVIRVRTGMSPPRGRSGSGPGPGGGDSLTSSNVSEIPEEKLAVTEPLVGERPPSSAPADHHMAHEPTQHASHHPTPMSTDESFRGRSGSIHQPSASMMSPHSQPEPSSITQSRQHDVHAGEFGMPFGNPLDLARRKQFSIHDMDDSSMHGSHYPSTVGYSQPTQHHQSYAPSTYGTPFEVAQAYEQGYERSGSFIPSPFSASTSGGQPSTLGSPHGGATHSSNGITVTPTFTASALTPSQSPCGQGNGLFMNSSYDSQFSSAARLIPDGMNNHRMFDVKPGLMNSDIGSTSVHHHHYHHHQPTYHSSPPDSHHHQDQNHGLVASASQSWGQQENEPYNWSSEHY